MNHLLRDARFGLRLMWRNPGFTATAVLALALGIAANTAIFSVVHATLLAPMPYPDSDRLVMVWSKIQGNRNVSAAGDFLDWRLQQILKEGMGTALAGVALGSLGAYLVGRAMQGMWFGVGVMDPVAFSAVALLLLGSAMLACLIPARRAASVDPMTALRQD